VDPRLVALVLLALVTAGMSTWAVVLLRDLRAEQRRSRDLDDRANRLVVDLEAAVEAARVAELSARDATQREAVALHVSRCLADSATGLLDARYFQPALEHRVAAARRLLRPVAVVLVELADTDPESEDASLAGLAEALRATLREADTVCRLDTRLGLILEDTPEGGAVWALERVRAGFKRLGGDPGRLTAGVAAYPAHTLEPGELLAAAQRALDRARATGRGHVAVASID
jgi:diguanylate cyclase (GGDEF)-like protein